MTYSKPHAENNRWIIAYTTRSHLLLDLDNTTLQKTKQLVQYIQQAWRCVGSALIMQSSTCTCNSYTHYHENHTPEERYTRENFHVIFNNHIDYDKCVKIIQCLAELDVLEPDYMKIREFRGDMSLRVSTKPLTNKTIPKPRIAALELIPNTKHVAHGIMDYLTLWSIC